MFFKKKISVEDYCTRTITPYFSGEWNETWEALRRFCNDGALSSIEPQLYYNHLRALFIGLMLIGIAKNCRMETNINAHIFTENFLKHQNHSEINELIHEYSQAFASSGDAPNKDGISEMVARFSDVVTSSRLQQATVERLHVELSAMLNVYFKDFNPIKLIPSRVLPL